MDLRRSGVLRRQRGITVKLGLPLVILLLCGLQLTQRIAEMDGAVIRHAVGQISWTQWALAAGATWASFRAIGEYDAFWHKQLRSGVNSPLARKSGMRAIAIGQLLGFGALTGSLVRWHCLPQQSLWQATKLSLVVTLAFTLCWAFLALLAAWWLGFGLGWLLLGFVMCCGFCVFGPGCTRKWAGCRITAANATQLIALTLADLAFAALAFSIFLPPTVDIPFGTILAAYAIALGVGLLSNTPGGAGAFELTLLGLLPQTAPEVLVAALIAYRAVYYFLPACVALSGLAAPAITPPQNRSTLPQRALALQNGMVQRIGGADLFTATLPIVTATVGPQAVPVPLKSLQAFSLRRGTFPVCYNACARTAAQARKAGWEVRRHAMEAVIDPLHWTTAGKKRQGLRRKLRKADAAGVVIARATAADLPFLAPIARAWAKSHGGEMGFSMGRFSPDLLADQCVYIIRQNTDIIGFISFLTSDKKWQLDLIRHNDALPCGAIHKAVVTAIQDARSARIKTLSLANVPDPRHTPQLWARRCAGLAQFKRSFGPHWVGRYHVAPNRLIFWCSAFAIFVAIQRPIANFPDKMTLCLNFIMQKYQVHFGISQLRERGAHDMPIRSRYHEGP